MSKFHINPENGVVSACKSTKGRCPFGTDAEHYTSKEAATGAYEKSMDNQIAASITKNDLAEKQYVLDYRRKTGEETGEGYSIERNSEGQYRWMWSERDSADDGSVGEWRDTSVQALREAANDWEDNGDNSFKYGALLRSAATRIERKALQKVSESS